MKSTNKLMWHPRLLELKAVIIIDNLSLKIGTTLAYKTIKALLDVKGLDFKIIENITRHYTSIKRLKGVNKKRYLQEVLLLGLLWNKSAGETSKTYLGRSVNIFRDNGKVMAGFIDDNWVNELDSEVCATFKGDVEKLADIIIFLENILG